MSSFVDLHGSQVSGAEKFVLCSNVIMRKPSTGKVITQCQSKATFFIILFFLLLQTNLILRVIQSYKEVRNTVFLEKKIHILTICMYNINYTHYRSLRLSADGCGYQTERLNNFSLRYLDTAFLQINVHFLCPAIVFIVLCWTFLVFVTLLFPPFFSISFILATRVGRCFLLYQNF